jgi:hypothetical protein
MGAKVRAEMQLFWLHVLSLLSMTFELQTSSDQLGSHNARRHLISGLNLKAFVSRLLSFCAL